MLLGGTGLVLAGVGMAAGSASAASSFTISGSLATVLLPGVSGPLDLTITNPNDTPLHLAALKVIVDSVTPATCAVTNFDVTQAVLPNPATTAVPAHAALSLSALGLTAAQLPQVRMVEAGTAQDECQGAVVHLLYAGTALGPDGSVPGGGGSDDDHDHNHDHDGHDHDGHHHGDDDGDDDDNDGSGSGTASADLPGTGGSGHESGMTAAGLGLVGVGSALTWVVRRRKGAGS